MVDRAKSLSGPKLPNLERTLTVPILDAVAVTVTFEQTVEELVQREYLVSGSW